MEDFYLKLLIALSGIILSAIGYGLQYMLKRISQIVPQDEIRQMIDDRQRATDSERKNLDERLTRLEAFFFRLLEDELQDDNKKKTPKDS